MLDGRQLGQDMPNYSKDNYKALTRFRFDNLLMQNDAYTYSDFDEYFEVEPFIRNMVYIARHCGGHICWNHICLGSDSKALYTLLKFTLLPMRNPYLGAS
jgi:hypothetical protein